MAIVLSVYVNRHGLTNRLLCSMTLNPSPPLMILQTSARPVYRAFFPIFVLRRDFVIIPVVPTENYCESQVELRVGEARRFNQKGNSPRQVFGQERCTDLLLRPILDPREKPLILDHSIRCQTWEA